MYVHAFIIIHHSGEKKKGTMFLISPRKKSKPCRLSLLHDTLPLHHLDQRLESFWPPAADLDLTVLVAAEDPNQPIQILPGRILEVQRSGPLQLTVRFVPGKLHAGMVDTWRSTCWHFFLFSVGIWRFGGGMVPLKRFDTGSFGSFLLFHEKKHQGSRNLIVIGMGM